AGYQHREEQKQEGVSHARFYTTPEPAFTAREICSSGMWHPTRAQWWASLTIGVLLVAAWPPADDRSLMIKLGNWAVDPKGTLPTLPGPLAFGEGDDPAVVEAHDLQ